MKSIAIVLLVVGCGSAQQQDTTPPVPLPTYAVASDTPPPPPPQKKNRVGEVQTTASGLQYVDARIGDGPSPASVASTVTVHYTGTLDDGTKFDSSYDRNQPFKASLQHVIKGWQEGVLTMRVGGKRRLIIPPDLAYGSRSVGKIPASSTLTFDIELIAVDDGP